MAILQKLASINFAKNWEETHLPSHSQGGWKRSLCLGSPSILRNKKLKWQTMLRHGGPGGPSNGKETGFKGFAFRKAVLTSPFSSFFMIRSYSCLLGKSTKQRRSKLIRARIEIQKKKKQLLKRMAAHSKNVELIPCTRFAYARGTFGFSTLVKNDAMGVKKKYGHRVQVKKYADRVKVRVKATGWFRIIPFQDWKRMRKRTRRKYKLIKFFWKIRKKKKLYLRIKKSTRLFTVGKKELVTSRRLRRARRIKYKKYKKRKRKPRQKKPIRIPPGAKIGIIALKGTYNNIILTLTDTDGNTKAWVSAGTAGFKNGRKSSHFAAETAIDRLVDKSIALGYRFARVRMKGMGGGKLKAIRRLCKSRIKLLRISDHFYIPHNGCRRAREPRN